MLRQKITLIVRDLFIISLIGLFFTILVMNPKLFKDGCQKGIPQEISLTIHGQKKIVSMKNSNRIEDPTEVGCDREDLAFQMQIPDQNGIYYDTFIVCCSNSIYFGSRCEILK